MNTGFSKSHIAMAVAAALAASAIAAAPTIATAGGKSPGRYVAGDFHNHTTCSDGSISMEKLVKKATDKRDTPWGLDWFVQAGHGGNGNRNCTLVEDATLSTPAYPFVEGQSPQTTWTASIGGANLKGLGGGVGGNGNMWRWQSIQEYQYPLLEYLSVYRNVPLFIGMESVVAGHEHSSMSVITGQMPARLDRVKLPKTPGYSALGNATALAQWSYCFDRGDTDTSRGDTTGTAVGNNWNCSVPGSANAGDAAWNVTAQKLMPTGGAGSGIAGHNKTLEGLKWMGKFHSKASYYVPAHLERAGPFNPDGNNGYNIEHLRNFNNAAPKVAFGMETQPGHGASSSRGEYSPNRNNIGGVLVDSVGGTTYGGTGVYGAQVGGVWDALLGEGRNFWFFASSDWHNRGSFGPDDRRSTQDFYPGEYQRNYTMVRDEDEDDHGHGSHGRGHDDDREDEKLRPQSIVDGLRTGNNFAASGQLIDRLAFVACASYGPSRPTPFLDAVGNAIVETAALAAAIKDTDVDVENCAPMGEKLVVRPGADIIVAIVVRDPSGTNYSPYTFPNPSLAQIGVNQPLNKPVLDHIDVIRGRVSGYRTPGAVDYAGAWPNTWLANPDMNTVPAGAKNPSAAVIKTFSDHNWEEVRGKDFVKMSFRIPAVTASQYIRLRGTNLPAAVPYETDANGNPLADLYTNASNTVNLRIPCTTVGTNVPENGVPFTGVGIDGCPKHLAIASSTAGTSDNPIAGQKAVSYDVAAWSDLWFYSNPIYVEVKGSTRVAGVQ